MDGLLTAELSNLSSLDTELFIHLVKKHPELWQLTHAFHNDCTAGKAAWCAIARESIPKSVEWSENCVDLLVAELEKKWKTIKKSYLNSLKARPTGSSEKHYIYTKQLSFLKEGGLAEVKSEKTEVDYATETLSNLQRDNQPDMEVQQQNSDLDRRVQENETTPKNIEDDKLPYGQKRAQNHQNIEAALIQFMSEPNPMSQIAVASTDRLFFESILPSVRSFTEDEKLNFRYEVLDIIKRLRFCQYASTDLSD